MIGRRQIGGAGVTAVGVTAAMETTGTITGSTGQCCQKGCHGADFLDGQGTALTDLRQDR